jgi:hypothetical protein
MNRGVGRVVAVATWEFTPENIAARQGLFGAAGRNVGFVQHGHNSWAKRIVVTALELKHLPHRVLDVTAVNQCC